MTRGVTGKIQRNRMADEDHFAFPLEDTVVLDSPILETHQETLDINTKVLDVLDSNWNLSDQTVDDTVDNSVQDVVLDSDEEGNEILGIFSGKETNKRKSGHALKTEKRKLTASGFISRLSEKVCGHSLQSLSSARSTVTDEHYNAGQPGAKSLHAESRYPEPFVKSDSGKWKLKEKILSQSNVNNSGKDQKRLLCYKKRARKSLARDALDKEKSAPNNCETLNGGKDIPSEACHNELAIVGDTDSQEPGEPSQVNALDFVNHFLSVTNLELSGGTENGRANRTESPPTSRAKGAQILARRANLGSKARESAIFDWPEKQPGESDSDEHFIVEPLGHPLEEDDSRENTPEVFDVGFNTQMAAEAMEALLYANPPNSNVGFSHQGPEITILCSSEGESKSMKPKACAYQHTVGSNSQITGRQSENQRESNSVPPIENNIICREPLTGELVNCRHPVSMKKTIKARYSRRIHQQKQDGTQERQNLKEACPDIILSSSVVCKLDDIRKSSHATNRTKCQSSVNSSEVCNDSILCHKTRKCSRVEFDVPKKQRKNNIHIQVHKMVGVRGKCITSGVDAYAETSKGKRLLKLDPWNHPKGKRTYRLRRNANRSSSLSAFLIVAEDINKNKYPYENSKIMKRKRGLELKSSMERRPSVGLPKVDAKESPDFCNCESGITGEQMDVTELDRGKSLKQSGKSDKGLISSVAYSRNIKLDAVLDDTNLSETCKKPGKTILSRPSLVRELTRLGYNKFLPDFMPRELRRRKTANVCVLFSQHLESTITNQQKKIMEQLGFLAASCCSDATHFIADRFLRTRNMLEAIAFGKPIVTHLWLESCRQANCYIDEKNYILRDAKKEKEIGFSMPVSLACASQHPLLKGRRVFITPNIKPVKELVHSLVKAVQGKVVQRIQRGNQKSEIISNDVLILSSAEDYTTCVPFLEKGAAVYDSELLLNGIVTQKLEYERHRLFTNYVGGNSSSKWGRKKRDVSLIT